MRDFHKLGTHLDQMNHFTTHSINGVNGLAFNMIS